MTSRATDFRWIGAILIILTAPVISQAQEATITGTITDTTGGVLPGVTATAARNLGSLLRQWSASNAAAVARIDRREWSRLAGRRSTETPIVHRARSAST